VRLHQAKLEAPVAAAAPSATTPQVRALESSGGLLDAQKLLLCAGVAMQDVGLMFHVSRAMMSAAQELHCLQVTQEHVRPVALTAVVARGVTVVMPVPTYPLLT
jgi:hypothetical protein